MKYEAEYTDTFSGEANYSWVKRAQFDAPADASVHTLMRRARKALDLTGLRGRVSELNDCVEFRPYGMCTVLFIVPTVEVSAG